MGVLRKTFFSLAIAALIGSVLNFFGYKKNRFIFKKKWNRWYKQGKKLSHVAAIKSRTWMRMLSKMKA